MNKKFAQLGAIALILMVVLVAGCAGGGGTQGQAPGNGSSRDKGDSAEKTREINTKKIKKNALEVSYEKLVRKNEDFVGKTIHYMGKIVQNEDSFSITSVCTDCYKPGTNVIFLSTTSRPKVVMPILGSPNKETSLVEDDLIDLWGEVKGLKTYETTSGKGLTVPEIDLIYAKLINRRKPSGGLSDFNEKESKYDNIKEVAEVNDKLAYITKPGRDKELVVYNGKVKEKYDLCGEKSCVGWVVTNLVEVKNKLAYQIDHSSHVFDEDGYYIMFGERKIKGRHPMEIGGELAYEKNDNLIWGDKKIEGAISFKSKPVEVNGTLAYQTRWPPSIMYGNEEIGEGYSATNPVEVNGKLAYQVRGAEEPIPRYVYYDGKKYKEARNPFEFKEKLGYIRGGRIVYNGKKGMRFDEIKHIAKVNGKLAYVGTIDYWGDVLVYGDKIITFGDWKKTGAPYERLKFSPLGVNGKLVFGASKMDKNYIVREK